MAININKEITYKTAQPKEKEYLISEGGSLYLLVKPEGAIFDFSLFTHLRCFELPR
ncbi:MAG: hypothetical protein RLZ92_1117 [Pseudomonadota bacterium]|jgi:hypothetical protein